MSDQDASAEPEQSLSGRAASGFAWAIVGFLLLQLGSFGTYTVATRVLGPEGVGVVGAAVTLVFFIDVLLDLGMGASVIYEQEQGQTDRTQVAFTVNTAVSIFVALVVLVGAPVIDAAFGAGDVNMFRLVAVLVLAKGLNQVPDAMLKRGLDFRRRSAADLTRSLGRFGVATGLLLSGVGPISLIIGVVVAETAATSVTWWLLRFRPTLRWDRVAAAEMLRYGAAIFGQRAVGILWLNGDYLVLARKYRSESPEFGNYFTAFRLPQLVLGSVYAMFANVSFPAFSAARSHGEEKLREASLKALKYLSVFGFTASVGMALVARDFIITWFGSDYRDAIAVMEVLCIGGGFAGVGYASGELFSAIGKPRLGFYFTLGGTPILLGLMWAVVDRGILAVAYVHLAVIVPYSLFRIEVANRVIGTTWRQSLRAMRPAAAATLGLLALGLPLRLVMAEGAGALFAIMAAGAAGALLGTWIGDRELFDEVRDVALKAAGRA